MALQLTIWTVPKKVMGADLPKLSVTVTVSCQADSGKAFATRRGSAPPSRLLDLRTCHTQIKLFFRAVNTLASPVDEALPDYVALRLNADHHGRSHSNTSICRAFIPQEVLV